MDSVGTGKYNLIFLKRRAEMVKKYLMEKSRILDRLIVKGYGEDRPAASNETKEGRQMNRRVQLEGIQVTPSDSSQKKVGD